MNVLTLWGLRRCTRAELRALLDWISNAIGLFPEGSQDYQNALTNLRHIRWMLAHFDLPPVCRP